MPCQISVEKETKSKLDRRKDNTIAKIRDKNNTYDFLNTPLQYSQVLISPASFIDEDTASWSCGPLVRLCRALPSFFMAAHIPHRWLKLLIASISFSLSSFRCSLSMWRLSFVTPLWQYKQKAMVVQPADVTLI